MFWHFVLLVSVDICHPRCGKLWIVIEHYELTDSWTRTPASSLCLPTRMKWKRRECLHIGKQLPEHRPATHDRSWKSESWKKMRLKKSEKKRCKNQAFFLDYDATHSSLDLVPKRLSPVRSSLQLWSANRLGCWLRPPPAYHSRLVCLCLMHFITCHGCLLDVVCFPRWQWEEIRLGLRLKWSLAITGKLEAFETCPLLIFPLHSGHSLQCVSQVSLSPTASTQSKRESGAKFWCLPHAFFFGAVCWQHWLRLSYMKGALASHGA